MTPEQLKKKPINEILRMENEKLNTEEEESTNDEDEFTTFTELSEQDSASDITADDTEQAKPTETHQVHNVLNKTTHDQDDSIKDQPITEIELPTKNGEQNIGKENKLLNTNFQVEMEN